MPTSGVEDAYPRDTHLNGDVPRPFQERRDITVENVCHSRLARPFRSRPLSDGSVFPSLHPGANSYQGNPGSLQGYQTRLTYIKQILTTIYVPDMVFRTCKARPGFVGDRRKVRVLLQRLNRTLDQPATAVDISMPLVVVGGAWPGFVFADLARGYGVRVERDDPMLLRIAIEETFGSAR
ncbi:MULTISPECIES: hypothetical protein [Burkholderia]|uniref:hypothetical protein n=1 Tax=Burkholderia TaxID=32008 RepID=UPI0011783D15|nr:MULTISPECIES: hypothetical protein [Burkholderia]EKS9794032.1 hypothetical protein [Burkholderia cepacia]EKS9803563.1 hypothetical protein [Burkholderia cepacia]EKS9811695.1 hypothetical protein [Burkholderia cepacia]EKS9822442.1 hypothetical protein [Burkholderia cepacia]EKS9826127.1 hypothetical protein [Burkholderia cepacia]